MRHILLPARQPRARTAARGTIEQREDAEARNPQHDDLAQRIESAEIDEDDIDDIGAAPARLGIGEVKGRNARAGITRQHRPGQPADESAAGDRQRRVAPFAKVARQRRRALGQQIEREQQQQHGHHLDRNLRQRQIGRGKAHEGEADHKPDHAEIDQHAQTLARILDHRKRRRDQQRPGDNPRRRGRDAGARAGQHPAAPQRALDHKHHHHREARQQHPLERRRVQRNHRFPHPPVGEAQCRIEHRLGIKMGCALPSGEQACVSPQQQRTACDRDQTQDQREIDPVPQREV